jgi:flagellar protein FliO/FliZ
MTASSGFTSFLWFVAVVAMIPLALWLLKRTPMAGARGNGSGAMRHVSTLPLSSSQRVVTVEVGSGEERRWLVLGVTPHSVSTLHSMPPQADAPAPGPATPVFAQFLERLRSGEKS